LETYIPKLNEINQKWLVVDADGQILGRLASEVASILRGKNKPIFTPHMDVGDHVIIINAGKIRVTGKKAKLGFVQSPKGLSKIQSKNELRFEWEAN